MDLAGRDVYIDLIERGTNMLSLTGSQIGGREENICEGLTDILDGADLALQSVGLPGNIADAQNSEESGKKSMDEAALAVADAKLLSICCSIAKGQVEGIDANLDSYHAGVFIDNVVSLMESSVLFTYHQMLDWTRLDGAVASCFRFVPAFTPMLGALPEDPVGPPKARQRRAPAAPVAPTRRPINVTNEEEGAENEEEGVEEMVRAMIRHLRSEYKRSRQPICYFRFLVDPRSFGATVENMFHMAFLIKENHVQLGHNERGLPVLTPVKPNSSNNSESSSQNQQMITSLCPQQWREIIDLLKIKEPFINRRLPEELPSLIHN